MFTPFFARQPRALIEGLTSPVRRTLRHRAARRQLERAIHAAYEPFANQYGIWAASFFDEHFLTTQAAPHLLDAWESGGELTPARLAALWRAQFLPSNALAEALVGEATHVAMCFLVLLAAELDPATTLAVACAPC